MVSEVNTPKCTFFYLKTIICQNTVFTKKTRNRAGLFRKAESHQVFRLAGRVTCLDAVSDVMELTVLED
jgi:hypothetical protein